MKNYQLITMLKLLFLSTPVGYLSSGQGGGVELTVLNLAQELQKRGHKITVVAPINSHIPDVNIVEIDGNLQVPVQTQSRDIPVIMPNNSVLGNMWEYARLFQNDYDLIVNFAFDWLPFYLTPFFTTKIAHFVSMGSMTDTLDQIMNEVAVNSPGTIGVYTKAQADTFSFGNSCEILSSAIDLSLYNYNPNPENFLVWLGRISPEKALEDAVEAAQITNIKLRIFGKIQDKNYWENILTNFPNAPLEYGGFLNTKELQQEVGKSKGLLMTHRWIEAFGNVAIEALACGVPVISYRRGGPTEIVKHGKTGFLVEPDHVAELVNAINNIDQINRYDCRQQAEHEYSLQSLGDRFEQWFNQLIVNPD
jgi:UDP-glucose:tetrahydrobiopterin glucosyltransferase